jgi:membrane protein involved in colicin uptake
MTATDPPQPPTDVLPDDPPPADPPPAPAPHGDDHVRTLTNDLKAERAARKKLADEYAKLQRSHMDDDERKLAEAHAAGRAEALAEANGRLLRAEVRAVAAAKLADADDAVRLLDLDSFEPSADGAFDRKAIDSALDALVESKPYLAKSVPNGQPAPRMPQGTRGTPGAPVEGASETDGDSFLRGLLKP